MNEEFRTMLRELITQAENALSVLRSGSAEYAYYVGRKDTCEALLLSEELGEMDIPEWPVGLPTLGKKR